MPPRVTSASTGAPERGKRSASRTAAATSTTPSEGRRGRSTTPSTPAFTTATRDPDGIGTRGTTGMWRYSRRNVSRKPRCGQKRDESRLVDAPVGDHDCRARARVAQANAPRSSATPAPEPRTSGSVAAQPSRAAPSGRPSRRARSRARRGRAGSANERAVALGDEIADLRLREVFEESARSSSGVFGAGRPAKVGRRAWWSGESRGEREERVDVCAPRRGASPPGQSVVGHLTGSPCACCCAEADARPRAEQLRIVGRRDRVVAHVTLVDPAPGGGSVEVAEVLRLLDCVAGELDPDVLAPDRARARRADQVADRSAVAQRNRSRDPLEREQRLHFGLRRRGLFELRGQQRLGGAMRPVAGRQELAGGGDELGGKWANLEACHRRGTIA